MNEPIVVFTTSSDIEASVVQSKIECAALKPFYWCTINRWKRLRNRDHSRV